MHQNLKCANWELDMTTLSKVNNMPTTVHYFSQALIHSNLFESHINRHGKLTDLTLNEMATRNLKKPFICVIIDGHYYIYHSFMLFYVFVCFLMFFYVFLCFFFMFYINLC